MTRNEKIKLLTKTLQGETESLRVLRRNWLIQPPTGDELRALSNQTLMTLLEWDVPLKIEQLSTAQLEFMVKCCREYSEEQERTYIDLTILTMEELEKRLADSEAIIE